MIDLIAPTGIDYPEVGPNVIDAIVYTDFHAYERTFLRSDVEKAHTRVATSHGPERVQVSRVWLDESELTSLLGMFADADRAATMTRHPAGRGA